MAWIESHQSLRQHPKLSVLAQRLQIDRASAIGHLHLLWWWCVDYAPTGELRKYNDMQVAAAAEWSGEAKTFMEALVEAGFLDRAHGVLAVHDWLDFCGELVEKRIARLSEKRQNMSALRRKVSAQRRPTNRTVPNRTVPNPSNSSKPPPNGLDAAIANPTLRSAWQKAFPHVDLDHEAEKMRAWLLANPHRGKSDWPRFVQNWLARAAPSPQHARPKGFASLQQVDAEMRAKECVIDADMGSVP